MSVAELSRAGSHVELEVDLVVVAIQRQHLLDQWVLVALEVPQLVAREASEAAFAVDSMGEGVEVGSEEGSKTEEAMEVVAGEVSASEEVSVVEIVVGMEMVHPLLTPQLGQEDPVVVVDDSNPLSSEMNSAAATEAQVVILVLQTAMALVGMIRVVVVAHLMIDLADIVAVVEVTPTVTVEDQVEAAAIWSR